MPEYPRGPFEKTGTSITPNVDGDTLDATIIGETTPAAGSFTTITATDQNVNALILGGASAKGGDVSIYRDASGNKQIAIDADAASSEKALDVYGGTVIQNHLTVGQTVLDNAYTLSVNGTLKASGNVSCDMGIRTESIQTLNNSPLINLNIPIGGTDSTDHNICMRIDGSDMICAHATGDGVGGIVESSKLVEITAQLQGNLLNNQMVSKATFDILGLMTDPRFLNLQCEDPGAGTMIDVSGQGNDGTYQGSMTSGDRVIKGMGWTLDFDGINDYVDLGDSDNLSLGNGTDDEEVTFFFVCEVITTGLTQVLFSKYNYLSGSEEREYNIDLMSTKQLRLLQFDESDDKVCLRKSDDEISDGYHSVVISSPGTGGATAMDNIKMYIDGILIASTATNNASYVAMENTGTSLLIGTSKDTSGNPDNNFEGNVAMVGMDGSEWSAFDVNRFHQLCKGLYAL